MWPCNIRRDRNGEKIYEMYADQVDINKDLKDDLFALPGDGSGKPVGTLLADRPEGDGPQLILGGPPHGLHSWTVQSRKWTMARQGAIPQQRPGFGRPQQRRKRPHQHGPRPELL